MIGFSSGHVSDRAWTRAGPPTSPPRPPAQSSSLPAPATSCSPWPPPWLPGDEVLILRHWRVDFFVAIDWFVHSSLALNKSWHDFVHVIFYLLSDVAEAVRTRINFFKHFCHNWNAAEQWSSENTEKLEKLCKFSYFLFTLSNMSLVAGFNQVTKLAAGSTNWIFWLSG